MNANQDNTGGPTIASPRPIHHSQWTWTLNDAAESTDATGINEIKQLKENSTTDITDTVRDINFSSSMNPTQADTRKRIQHLMVYLSYDGR